MKGIHPRRAFTRRSPGRSVACLTAPNGRPMVPRVEWARFEGAAIGYDKPLLSGLSFSVRSGERLAVLGPNGGGKSTLLRSLLRLQPLLEGKLVFPEGRPPRLGYVPQSHRADPVYPLTAHEVVLQGRIGVKGLFGFLDSRDRQLASAQLERVGLSAVAHRPLRSLSGGQRQRVLLARALAAEPELLVLDEFTSELDPAGASILLDEVSRLTSVGMGVVFVSHDVSAAAGHATHLAMVDAAKGSFEVGPTESLLTSERLTRLYGRPMQIERRGNKAIVYVETEMLRAGP